MRGSLYPSREYARPWKLVTLTIGVILLLLGARYTPAPDWDVPVSFLMAGCTYLTAPWLLHVLLERRWRLFPVAVLAAWVSVDGGYALYWSWRDPSVLALMRDVNFPASLALYAICGLLWFYRGSLREAWAELVAGARALARRSTPQKRSPSRK